jgi:hypothetical protein
MMEISAMAWDAKVIEPSAAEDVTVLMRVTYHSIEALCGDLFDETDQVHRFRSQSFAVGIGSRQGQ